MDDEKPITTGDRVGFLLVYERERDSAAGQCSSSVGRAQLIAHCGNDLLCDKDRLYIPPWTGHSERLTAHFSLNAICINLSKFFGKEVMCAEREKGSLAKILRIHPPLFMIGMIVERINVRMRIEED